LSDFSFLLSDFSFLLSAWASISIYKLVLLNDAKRTAYSRGAIRVCEPSGTLDRCQTHPILLQFYSKTDFLLSRILFFGIVFLILFLILFFLLLSFLPFWNCFLLDLVYFLSSLA
jgi:hypothetical protein